MIFCNATTGQKVEEIADPQECTRVSPFLRSYSLLYDIVASLVTSINWAPDGSLFTTTGGNIVKLWTTPK